MTQERNMGVGRPVKVAACGSMPPDPKFTNCADLMNWVLEGAKWASSDQWDRMQTLKLIQRVIADHAHLIPGDGQ